MDKTGNQQAIHYYHTDILGSPIAGSDAKANLEWQEDYAPYGKRLLKQGKDNGQWYTGKTEDEATGFIYMNARYYDPEIARFISPDPVHFTEKNPFSFNRYAYTANNPLTRIDPTGKDWVYSQSSGRLTHIDSYGNSRYMGRGYSGYGPGYNNPAMQEVRAMHRGEPAGPIPRGFYEIGSAHRSPNVGRGTMDLTPLRETNTFGRDLFRIHGDNRFRNRTGSTGCIILGPAIRDQINDSDDHLLRVIQ